jgi:hypothetical protein
MAPCGTAVLQDAVTKNIDQLNLGGMGCDGNYAVVEVTHRSCAGNSSGCISEPSLAFFVARDGDWTLITVGAGITCEQVAGTMNQPTLPASLCAQATSTS